MNKHTPGPWETPGVDGGARVICANARDKARTIAHVYGDSHEHMDANARLIAAAPDMAEALDDARETFEALYAFQPIWGREMVEHCLFTISAALERAGLGES